MMRYVRRAVLAFALAFVILMVCATAWLGWPGA